MKGAWALLRRDLLLLARTPGESLIPLAFFILLIIIFPLAAGPNPKQLQAAAPGIVWSAALLASLLAQESLFRRDSEDGALTQLLLSGNPITLLVAAKTAAHWLSFGAPAALFSPLLGLWLSMPASTIAILFITLLLGTAAFSLFAAFSAALLAGGSRGSFLGALLCLPMCIPAVIFASAALTGQRAPLLLLAAFFVFAATILPLASAAALRLSMMR